MTIPDSAVFVTGANRGLGLAFAQEALRRRARKVYADVRNLTEANTPGIVQIKLDVTNLATDQILREALATSPRILALFCDAPNTNKQTR